MQLERRPCTRGKKSPVRASCGARETTRWSAAWWPDHDPDHASGCAASSPDHGWSASC
ncbi:hypothetical protein BN159_p8 (plasmid) [Streptomyces davaonensis JCM 4913]|uniref:Uncharacterized protein n=1 Tax=Streptomyces davaonensis (strain DSM 101723 / JCM 4913 / KCC S-0913 / 768) TaxID=1214101 RepID=K4RH28_STRDJ|nr:hypothetical protein BN159_p8 [Streptomyces davaonensis JCM 4913]